MDIRIIRMQLAPHPVVSPNGNACVAYFDLHVGPLAIRRCTLVKRGGEYQDMKVYPPICKVHGEKTGITFRDYDFRQEVQRRAVAMYGLQVGEDA